MTPLRAFCALLAVMSLAGLGRAQPLDPDHAAKMAKGLDLFKSSVRPVLVEKCLKCHGGAKVESELDLVDRDGLLKGGSHGKAVEPGKSQASRLVKMLRHQVEPAMPKNGPRLADETIDRIAQWIDLGAPYDAALVETKKAPWTARVVAENARKHWAFRPLQRSEPPAVKNAAWPKTSVDRYILAGLEKAGLAPNPAATKQQLVRRAYFDLIGLPPTPEQVDAFVNDPSSDAWPKLIDSLLASPHYGERWARHWLDLARFAESHGFEHDTDRPTAFRYRDFVIEALNRDLPYDTFVRWQIAGDEYADDDPLANEATGFLAAGVHSTQITKSEAEKHRYDELDDMVATLGTSMLGLSIGCARCHDHKYDPIPARDYYRMLATFTKTVRAERKMTVEGEKKSVKILVATEGLKAVRLHTQGDDFMPDTYFLRRGDLAHKEGVADQSFLQVLMPGPDAASRWIKPPPTGSRTPWKRRALAEWLTDVDHGGGTLLARVIVNRLWQHHLGQGIVATPSDFGLRGERPTHPELLDHLAAKLIDSGGSLKAIHKLILTSETYRQSSAGDEGRAKIDSGNKLVWRNPSRRLSAEVIRDSLLAVSGQLDPKLLGPGTLDESSKRRSIYFTVKRSRLMPMMVIFDAPEALGGVAQRPTTTIAPQALHLMNNETVRKCAKGLASRAGGDVDRAYRIALGRRPTSEERDDAAAFLRQQTASYTGSDAASRAMVDFCQVLLCVNEFVYVD